MQTRTFLFADLRDYTRFVELHGDAAAKTLIADYRSLVRAEVARHEGAEVKTEGDSFYVVFTSARQALACGTAILREAERYSQLRPDRPVRVGVGVHAGEPEPHEGQFVGAAVIIAARLAQAAGAGEMLASEVVRGLLSKDAAPPMDERTGLVLKGLEHPPRVYAVAWERMAPEPASISPPATAGGMAIEAPPPQGHQVLCPDVVGRDTELAALDAFLADARAGKGRAVLVAGDAGLGKSALLRLFLERARASGARTLVGECSEVEARRPFGPVIDALSESGLPLPAELRQGAPGAQPSIESETYRVHAGFTSILEDAARETPLVLAIEDLHWADPATLELVPFLARKLRGDRVLLIATYRSDELHRRHPLNHLLAELSRGRLSSEVKLHPLSEDETALVIKGALGLHRAPTTAFRKAIQDRCAGNPFFVEEVLAALVDRGDLTYREGAWRRSKEVHELVIPVSVRDAVEQRLRALSPGALRSVHVASVIGQRFDFELLRTVTGISETELLEALREAVDAQLVIEDAAAAEEAYRFRHALTREAVLDELMARERRILHRSIGEAIEAAAGANAERRAEELAYHFDEARDTDRARRYHDLAAEHARRSFAYAAALAHRERAVELMADDDPSLAEAQLRLGVAALEAGEVARARRAAAEARRGFERQNDQRQTASAMTLIAVAEGRLGQTDQARQLIDEAIRILEPLGPSTELARAYVSRAGRAMFERHPDAVALGRQAIDMAEQTGELELRVRAMVLTGTSMMDEEGLSLVREALELALRHEFVLVAQTAHNNTMVLLSATGAPVEEVDRVRDEYFAFCRRYGLRGGAVASNEAGIAFLEGEWDRALAIVEEERDESMWSASRETMEALVRTARDGPEAGVPLIAGPRARLLASGDPQWVGAAVGSALTYLLAGDYHAAIGSAEPAVQVISTDLGDWSPVVTAAVSAAMIASLRLADREAAMRWAEIASTGEPQASGRDRSLPRRLIAAAVQAQLGSESDVALEELAEAAGQLEQDRGWILATFVRMERARLLAERGDREAARAEIEAVLPFWRKGKATWFLGRLAAFAAEHGLTLTAA